MNILITGARGFIGSAIVRRLAQIRCITMRAEEGLLPQKNTHTELNKWPFLYNIDKVTAFIRDSHAIHMYRLESNSAFDIKNMIAHGKLHVTKGDMNGDIAGLCEGIDVVIHCAAKTFVDHSIRDPRAFVESNTVGTLNLLEEVKRQGVKIFIHMSTDEVYGQILQGAYSENAPINPRNPYAASKAAADALTISYNHTYSSSGLWTAVTRTENNYGAYQHPQKAIPRFIQCAMQNAPLPVYGDGSHVRQWIHVDDHIDGLFTILNHKILYDLPGGEVWHIAGSNELTNLELANKIIGLCQSDSKVAFIDDHHIRPGHDRRYALNCDKLRGLGWSPVIDINTGLKYCVDWYRSNQYWL